MGHRAAVLGASGYSGGELVRLLDAHPAITVEALAGASTAGSELGVVHPHLAGDQRVLTGPEEALAAEVDVLFSCLPSGTLGELLGEARAGVVVDLSDEHRGDPGWVYGLTEFARARLQGARRIANPGCYPTASLLALLPFARAGVIGDRIVIDAMSGYSGAGRSGADHLMMAAAAGSVLAYGSTEHRHIPEMERCLSESGSLDATVSFTPHLVPMARGLLVTARAEMTTSLDDGTALEILAEAYAGEEAVVVTTGWPQTKAVAGSNRAHVSARVDHRSGYLICCAAIDNLGKGAAGQAIQNANVALGLDEHAGLGGGGVWP